MSDEKDVMHRERLRVLVVDDEPAICKALTIALQRAGYDALSAQSGDSALALLANDRGDVVFELAAATHPHLRHQTLFMTGDISERAHRLVTSCKCPMLRKPFELREMIAAIELLTPHQKRDAQGQSA
jgi:DNA-binding response OmpR family regulator